MELQNQLYVIISVFAGLVILLLILIALLSIYVKKSIDMISTNKAREDYSNKQIVAMKKHAIQCSNSDTRGSLNDCDASEMYKNQDGFSKTEACITYDNRGYRKEIVCGRQVAEKGNDISRHGSIKHPDTIIARQHLTMLFESDGSNIFHADRYGEASDDLEIACERQSVRYIENRMNSSSLASETISSNNSRIRREPISGHNTKNSRANQHHAQKNIKRQDVIDAFVERNPSRYYYGRDTHEANISFYEGG